MIKIAPKGSSEAFLRANVKYVGDACLDWPYRPDNRGYGLAVIGGVQKRASRWMCILAHGEPPTPRHHAAHSCGRPCCVNPNHLRWATVKENMADKLIHGTHNRGERNGKTHLTNEDVAVIRSAPADLKALSERFRVSKGCIVKIRSGQRWATKNVDPKHRQMAKLITVGESAP